MSHRTVSSLPRLLPTVTSISIWLVLMVLLASCASTDELKDDEMDHLLDEATEEYSDLADLLDEMSSMDENLDESTLKRIEVQAQKLLDELPELDIPIESYRSRFADQIALSYNEIPEIYLQVEEEDRQRQSNRGYRIQIISTQDARLANEIQDDFEEWISDVTAPPHARTYMLFQQPYYRVQVGDFLDREKAMEFTEFVRLRYPDAWVIHSQIHPGRVER